MIKGNDWTKVLFICMCSFNVILAHPCGENPLRRFEPLTRILNEAFPDTDLSTILSMLRDSKSPAYTRLQPLLSLLQTEWRLYANCVGLVDTGYFKRSDPSSLIQPASDQTLGMVSANDGGDMERDSGLDNSPDYPRYSRLLEILHDARNLDGLSLGDYLTSA